jgi:ribosomal protein S18
MPPEEIVRMREKVLRAKIEELRSSLPEDRKSLGQLVSSLGASFTELGEGFKQVQEFNQNEQRVIADAKSNHQRALSRVTAAEAAIKEAEKKWNWFGRREKAVAEAQQALDNARAAEEIAMAGIDTAQKKAEDLRSERLMDADFQSSFDVLRKFVTETERILSERIEKIEEQTNRTREAKDQAFTDKEKAAKKLEEAKVTANEKLATLAQETEALQTLEVGTEARATQEKKVAQAQREAEEAKAEHDKTLVIFQSLEKSTVTLTLAETSLMAGLHEHRVTFAQLVADSEAWFTEFDTRVAQIQAMASQTASANLIDTGAAVRSKLAEDSARFAVASLKQITERAERHPGQLQDIMAIRSALAEGMKGMNERWAKIEEDTRARAQGTPSE